MMHSQTVAVTVDASGNATAYTAKKLNGVIRAITYEKTDFAQDVDFTITTEDTLQDVWVEDPVNASETIYPSVEAQETDGTANTNDHVLIPVVNERIKIVVASGGNAKSGSFIIIWEGTEGIS